LQRRFLIVLGTRPEAIKLAPLILELRRRDPLSIFVCATGQRDGMVDRALEIFRISADLNLRVMRPGQSLAATSAAILQGIDRVIIEHRPEWVVVQGDTVTASMAALCAFYRGCRIGHVEAGLRTGDLQQPFPEELNRRVVSIVATQHFAPTVFARENLLREGVPEQNVQVTGNTGIDALYGALAHLRRAGELRMDRDPDVLRMLVTAHRRENQDGGIRNVCLAVRRIATKWEGRIKVIWPVHPNPLVETVVRQQLSGIPEVDLVDPLPYEAMVRELYHADLVVSDSGGIQEEAPSLGKRVLVLRYATERPEGVRAGVADLIGTDAREVFRAIDSALKNETGRIARVSPYGDGKAAMRIADFLLGQAVEQFHEAGSEPLDASCLLVAAHEDRLATFEDRHMPLVAAGSEMMPMQ
jgi:UDP-N-acetylglucosamine 2-epimerase (non-hydrolysing)